MVLGGQSKHLAQCVPLFGTGKYHFNIQASERCLQEAFEPRKIYKMLNCDCFYYPCLTHNNYFQLCSILLCIFLQEVQRNGKASIPAGRWPSLLSLTCPRSSGSGSGSELSLSSACSEYSSGSHTWAEGRGSSKQVCIIHLSSVTCWMEGTFTQIRDLLVSPKQLRVNHVSHVCHKPYVKSLYVASESFQIV